MSWEKKHNAILGYFQLEMWDDALKEIRGIPKEKKETSEIQALLLSIYMRKKNWKKALKHAQHLCRTMPENEAPFLDAAFCLHELKQTREAKQQLLSGPETLKSNGTYYYNMACYEAQLGELELAKKHLDTALEMDDRYRVMFYSDPDLKPLRDMEDKSK